MSLFSFIHLLPLTSPEIDSFFGLTFSFYFCSEEFLTDSFIVVVVIAVFAHELPPLL